MKNRRHYQRYAITGKGWVDSGALQKPEYRIHDISASGVNITTDRILNEGELIVMDIHVEGHLLPFVKRVKGQVVQKCRQGAEYQYGIRFMEVTHKDMVEMDEYLRLNCGNAELHYTSHTLDCDKYNLQ